MRKEQLQISRILKYLHYLNADAINNGFSLEEISKALSTDIEVTKYELDVLTSVTKDPLDNLPPVPLVEEKDGLYKITSFGKGFYQGMKFIYMKVAGVVE